MKKQLVIVGITLVLLAVGLSGCSSSNDSNQNTNENTDTDHTNWTPGETDIGSVDSRIIGEWSARYETSDIDQYIVNFYGNNTCQYRDISTQQILWARFGMFPGISFAGKDGRIAFKDGFLDNTFEYWWSNNNNTITLDVPDKENLIFTRQGTSEPETNGDTGNYERLLIGSWKGTLNGDTEKFTFLSDKTFSMSTESGGIIVFSRNGNWSIVDNQISCIGQGETVLMPFSFSNNDNTLTLTQPDGSTIELQRQ